MIECIIKADHDSCRRAWFDEEKLRHWLVEVAAIRGDDFILTSRLPNVSGRHRICKMDESSLEFDWYVDGHLTQLNVAFENLPSGTRIVVDHDFLGPIPAGVAFPGGEYYGDQVWTFALRQLKLFLETGERAMKLPWPDSLHRIDHEITIKASVKDVWNLLTVDSELKQLSLCGDHPSVEPRVGGRYSFGWVQAESDQTDGPGVITEWEEPERLSHTWYGGRDSVITWELDGQDGDKTRVRFTHSGLIFSFAETWSYKLGWADHLSEMKRYLEQDTAGAR